MGLFDRNNYDRDFGARGNMGGNRTGGGGMRGMWNRAENGIRDAFDAGGYDRDYGANRGSSWAGDSYGGSSIRGGSFDRDDAYRAGGSYNQGGTFNQGGSFGRYDSTYRQGGSFGGGYGASSGHTGEGLGDRMRHGWHRLAEGARDAVGRNDHYDRDYGYRGSPNANVNGGLSRDNLSRDEHGFGATGYGRTGGGYDRSNAGSTGYDRDFGANRGWSGTAGGGMMGRSGYDRDFGSQDRDWMDRDRGGAGYKSREQTDSGDPFGDRAANTPIRMIRGGFRGNAGGMGAGTGGYDRQYKEGLGDEPYYNARDFDRGGMQGGGMSGYDRNFRNNRSDRNDWF